MEWYGQKENVSILNLEAEIAKRIRNFHQQLFTILHESFLEPAIEDIIYRTRGYSPAEAGQKTVNYLQQLYDDKYQANLSNQQVEKLQAVIVNGNWRTINGIENILKILKEELKESKTPQ